MTVERAFLAYPKCAPDTDKAVDMPVLISTVLLTGIAVILIGVVKAAW
jgi:hypothetical protein